MNLISHLREALEVFVAFSVFGLEAVSIFCVLVGFLKALTLFPKWNTPEESVAPSLQMRIAFSRWLSLALEFQLGADILSTTVKPTTADLIRLSIIAIVRTFLNYFLEKEIMQEAKLSAQVQSHQAKNL